MLSRKITSLQHPTVKSLVKLRTERAYRYEQNSALIVGKKMVNEVGATMHLRQLIVAEELEQIPSLPADEILVVPAALLKKITGVENPEPLAAVVEIAPYRDLSKMNYILVLDGIADPGNLGTLLRTALALGWEGVFLTPSSADPYNDKALRAAKGATFRLPLCIGTVDQLMKWGKKGFIADSKGSAVEQFKFAPPLMLILGSESHGASSFAHTSYPRLSIPMSEKMESLNVAGAGAILMFAMRKRL